MYVSATKVDPAFEIGGVWAEKGPRGDEFQTWEIKARVEDVETLRVVSLDELVGVVALDVLPVESKRQHHRQNKTQTSDKDLDRTLAGLGSRGSRLKCSRWSPPSGGSRTCCRPPRRWGRGEESGEESAISSALAGAACLLPGPGPTVWGSWGRRCSAAAREGTRRTPACPGSSRSPDSRIRETCTLQKNTDVVRSDPSAVPDFRGCLRTGYGVVHVEAVAFDVFQSHASVHKHPERKEELWAPEGDVQQRWSQRCYRSAPHRWMCSQPLRFCFGSVQSFLQQLK